MGPNRKWTVYVTVGDSVIERGATAAYKEQAVGVALQQLWREQPGLAVSAARAVTLCKHGHPLEGVNLKINAQGSRVCVYCGLVSSRLAYRRNGKLLPSGNRIAPKGDIFAWLQDNRDVCVEP